MPDHPAVQAAEAFRADLLRQERQTAARMVRQYGEIYARLQSQIKALDAEIAGMENPTPGRVARLARFRALRAQIEAEVGRFGGWADTEIVSLAQRAAEQGIDHAEQLTLLNVPEPLRPAVQAVWNRLPAEALEQLTNFLRPDSPLRQALVNQLGEAVAERAMGALLEGLAMGYNPRVVGEILRREMGMGLVEALRTARTSMLWAYRRATQDMYRANSDLVIGWIWHADLGPRTCMACIAQHGSLHPVSEVLNDHHNGRCAMIPVTKSWKDLGFEGIPDTNPKIPTGREWFATLTPEEQRKMFPSDVLYRAWRDGKVSWDDLIGTHKDPTYGEMLQLPSAKALLGDLYREYRGWKKAA